MKQSDETLGRRNRRRPGSADVSHAVDDRTQPYRHLRNPFAPLNGFSDDPGAAIHEAALVILETQGMRVLSSDARVRYHDGGAEVDETTLIVRPDRAIVNASILTAPRDITLHTVSLWGALLGGCDFVLHEAGWLESGLTTWYEKFILDIEMLQMFAEMFQPVGAAPSDLALEAVAERGAGGHLFGCAHTMERYRSTFYAPLRSDWRNSGAWADDGAKTATGRASGIGQSTFERYVAPHRDPAVVEALDCYVEPRARDGVAPPVT